MPDKHNVDQPAWPEALSNVIDSQLPDGGWGEQLVYYAHERTVTTLAALRVINTWRSTPGDQVRIERGLQALHKYAADLAYEPHEPVAFELVLPTIRNTLAPFFESHFPTVLWDPIEEKSREKLALISKGGHLLNPKEPRAWWFSLEVLSNHQLNMLDDSILEENGSIASSVAATAAYLGARRQVGQDSPRAAAYISKALEIGGGSVPFSWPVEIFELVWVLDALRRAGFRADELPISGMLDQLEEAWYSHEEGLSSSRYFRVNDGDDTMVGYGVLKWAGRAPADDACWRFWHQDHFRSYLDERTWSISTNIHALSAMRPENGERLDLRINSLLDWIRTQVREDGSFDDKWHLSPCYSVSHALPAVTGLDDNLAQRLISYLLRCQRMDGGWGHYGHSTLEETAHCSLALAEAYQAGLLTDLTPLAKANGYLKTNEDETPLESFWIGKTIFRPTKIVEASLFAARNALGQLGLAAVGQEPAEVAMINKLAAEGRYDLARPTLIHCRNGNTATELPTVPRNGHNGHGPVNGNNVLQSTSLSLYRLHYHIFLKPKRVDFIVDDVAQLIDETLREISEAYEWQLGKLCVEPGYVQLALSIQPTYSIEEVVGILKFISQRELIAAFPKGGSDLCAGELWSEGYMVASNGAPPSFEELETFLGLSGYQ